MRLTHQQIHEITKTLLQGAKVPEHQASIAAEIFVRASLRAVGHHDIYFLPQRLHWLTQGGVNPQPKLRLEQNFGATEVWDGDHGLGEICCEHITRRAIDLARTQGIGFATVKNSNHFLAASPYCEIGAEQDCLLLVFSNTDPCMAAPEGKTNIIGNDPMGFGLPRASGTPLLLDICMAYSSLGNLRDYAREQKDIPPYWAKDNQGQWTTDPQAALTGGSVQPMAGHKGFGLALMTEALTGLLSGGATANQVTAGGGINTHNQTVIALSLGAFGGASLVAERAEDLAARLKASEPSLRLPGERSGSEKKRILEQGLEIRPDLEQQLREWQSKLGISILPPPKEA